MFKRVITDDAVEGEPLRIDAEIETASSTETLTFPSDRLLSPSLTKGTARITVSGRLKKDGTKNFIINLFLIILKKSRLNSALIKAAEDKGCFVKTAGFISDAAFKILSFISPL